MPQTVTRRNGHSIEPRRLRRKFLQEIESPGSDRVAHEVKVLTHLLIFATSATNSYYSDCYLTGRPEHLTGATADLQASPSLSHRGLQAKLCLGCSPATCQRPTSTVVPLSISNRLLHSLLKKCLFSFESPDARAFVPSCTLKFQAQLLVRRRHSCSGFLRASQVADYL